MASPSSTSCTDSDHGGANSLPATIKNIDACMSDTEVPSIFDSFGNNALTGKHVHEVIWSYPGCGRRKWSGGVGAAAK